MRLGLERPDVDNGTVARYQYWTILYLCHTGGEGWLTLMSAGRLLQGLLVRASGSSDLGGCLGCFGEGRRNRSPVGRCLHRGGGKIRGGWAVVMEIS